MKTRFAVLSFVFILASVYYSFYSLMPREGTPATTDASIFSTERALVPLQTISQQPHYYGSDAHGEVRAFLVQQLQDLGLDVSVQEDYLLGAYSRSLNAPKNIIGVLKGTGTGKSLLLLSHYDSAKVPSLGASDAGSGVVTILEAMRAYKASGKQPVNDIIVLFSDAEELGLDGASLFVKQHPLAKNVGLVLNFEARGSGGPSNMIVETNGGNKNLIKGFIEANPEFPVASSLSYSIYKMLPNDTDSTVFREDGDIDSFFFAFIDDHFDYHTAQDTVERLDIETLQHQGSYLVAMLDYFSDADLASLKSDEDYVYVNAPFVKMISYPFAWVLPMLILAFVLFIGLLAWGFKKNLLKGRAVAKGFVALLLSLLICGLIGYYGWILLEKVYPQYQDIQQGFTYNGHLYIVFFTLLSLGITWWLYFRCKVKENVASFFIAPLTIWLLLNAGVAFYLEGAAFWIIPVYFGLLSLWVLLRQTKPNLLLLALLAIPAIFLVVPIIRAFPVGLGLKMLVASSLFTVLVFSLLLPVFGFYRWKKMLAGGSIFIAVILFFIAHSQSDYTEDRKKPNSLLYYQKAKTGESYWLTYDKTIDDWTKGYLSENVMPASEYITNAAGSKYNTGYTYAVPAPNKAIPSLLLIKKQDTVYDGLQHMAFTLKPQRRIHQMLLYTSKETEFTTLSFNGKQAVLDTAKGNFSKRRSDYLLTFHLTKGDSLNVRYTAPVGSSKKFKVLDYSFDLLSHPQFTINKRPKHMMPMPFVNTDAVVVESDIDLEE